MQNYSKELGLLRAIVRGMEMRPKPMRDITQEYLRDERLVLAHPVGEMVIVLNRPAADAFDNLSESLVMRSPAMERGATFNSIRSELLDLLVNYVGADLGSLNADAVTTLHAHLEQWFSRSAASRQIFIPCAISPWEAPRFSIGPVQFIYGDHVVHSEFYPPGDDDEINRDAFNRILDSMKASRAHWLACVSVEHCDQKKGNEIGSLTADLALAGLQLILPLFWDTRRMSRLDARRGEAQAQSISLSNDTYFVSYSSLDAGLPIGHGTLADALQTAAPVIEAVSRCVTSFATGKFGFPNLEQAWCNAAYWLHEALAEMNDAIAFAKLETALEVLTRAESTSGSESRLELILSAFYSLAPHEMLTTDSATTVKQFVKRVVGNRSRIIHGTWSTLNPRLGMDRQGMEQFVIEVIRRAVVELEAYTKAEAPEDGIKPFLLWVKAKSQQVS